MFVPCHMSYGYTKSLFISDKNPFYLESSDKEVFYISKVTKYPSGNSMLNKLLVIIFPSCLNENWEGLIIFFFFWFNLRKHTVLQLF